MAFGVNRVTLMGYVGQEPEVRSLPSGTLVATFSLATTERVGGKGDKREERTEWHNIVAYGKVAEVVRGYIGKGTPIYLEGRLQTRSWKNNHDEKMYKTEIVVTTLRLIPDGARSAGQADRAQRNQNDVDLGDMITDDDIPF